MVQNDAARRENERSHRHVMLVRLFVEGVSGQVRRSRVFLQLRELLARFIGEMPSMSARRASRLIGSPATFERTPGTSMSPRPIAPLVSGTGAPKDESRRNGTRPYRQLLILEFVLRRARGDLGRRFVHRDRDQQVKRRSLIAHRANFVRSNPSPRDPRNDSRPAPSPGRR